MVLTKGMPILSAKEIQWAMKSGDPNPFFRTNFMSDLKKNSLMQQKEYLIAPFFPNFALHFVYTYVLKEH